MYRIDQCSVFRNTVTVEGWSECEASPVVRYQGRTTISHAEHLLEPGAFRIVAIIWGEQIRHEDISLEFSNGEIIEGPGVVIKHPQDAEYDSILLDFMELTKTGGRILEIGSRARGGHTYYKNLVYPRLEYVGLDIYEGPNVDVI
jgi:hypothetical protein